MNYSFHYYNCSPDYISTIDSNLISNLTEILKKLPKRKHYSETAVDLFWQITSAGWFYSKIPSNIKDHSPKDLNLSLTLDEIKKLHNEEMCKTSQNLPTHTTSDFAKKLNNKTVKMGVQFGSLEKLSQDFIKYRISYVEKRLDLGIELVIKDKTIFSLDEDNDSESPVLFNTATNTLVMLGLECPICLIGIE